jgi:uncharacterized protein
MPGIDKSETENVWVLAGDGKVSEIDAILRNNSVLDANLQDEYGYSPLHAAVSYGHIDLIRLLMTYDAKVDIVDHDGDTPLHMCELREIAVIMVEEFGADPKIRNSNGKLVSSSNQAD